MTYTDPVTVFEAMGFDASRDVGELDRSGRIARRCAHAIAEAEAHGESTVDFKVDRLAVGELARMICAERAATADFTVEPNPSTCFHEHLDVRIGEMTPARCLRCGAEEIVPEGYAPRRGLTHEDRRRLELIVRRNLHTFETDREATLLDKFVEHVTAEGYTVRCVTEEGVTPTPSLFFITERELLHPEGRVSLYR